MTPIIERACVAIIEALRKQGDLCDDCGEPEYAQVEGSFEVEPVARAVLQAIRVPTEAMVEIAANQGVWDDDMNIPPSQAAEEVWQAMIDAALKEG
ncbi:hypothetical protein NCF86_03395 [Pelagerythrobacter marinus]|nr:hypothetical protein NCF86_03395 [Pelagerythrobacter marinus]